jgi:hypothetical protein
MHTRTPLIRRTAATATVSLIAAGLLATTSSTATATPDLSSGPDWTITQVAGGYQVALELDEPLPIVNDAPTLVVDGHDYGIATESADGLSLSVITSDPSVVDTDSVEMGWASGASEGQARPVRSSRRRRYARLLQLHRGRLRLRRPGHPDGRHRRDPR